MDRNASHKRKEMLWCLLFILPYSAFAIDNVIHTRTGKVRGTTIPYNGNNIQVFLGIPFAKPPIGNLRFRKTLPVDPWKGIYQATKFAPACYQPHPPDSPSIDSMPNQSEDCLYLNIWVPSNTRQDSRKAVMFWIYGGSFNTGSNRLPIYDGRVIASKGDVIIVTINYRITVLGFLSSTSNEAPGNMGLFDILEALKWVNKNIEVFGGDCNRITVFGESAGAISTGLLCVSPLAKDLFQRVIMESSSSANDIVDMTAHNLELAQKLAEAVGCASALYRFETFPDDVIKCLKTKDAKELVKVTASLKIGIVGFWTIVGDDFLPISPKLQLIAGNFHDADVLIGHNQDEGSFFFAGFYKLLAENNPQFNKTTGERYIREMFQSYPAKELVVQHYLGGLKEYDFIAIREQTYHSIGDYFIVCPDTYFGESYAKKGNNVYAYYFNVISSVRWLPRWLGSLHFGEIAFVFGQPLNRQLNYSAAERYLSRRIIKIWTQFAKHGNPGENWEEFSRENPYFKVLKTHNRKSYLEDHKMNCEFFRPFSGFD